MLWAVDNLDTPHAAATIEEEAFQVRTESESFLTGAVEDSSQLALSREQCRARAEEEARRIKRRMLLRAHASSADPDGSPNTRAPRGRYSLTSGREVRDSQSDFRLRSGPHPACAVSCSARVAVDRDDIGTEFEAVAPAKMSGRSAWNQTDGDSCPALMISGTGSAAAARDSGALVFPLLPEDYIGTRKCISNKSHSADLEVLREFIPLWDDEPLHIPVVRTPARPCERVAEVCSTAPDNRECEPPPDEGDDAQQSAIADEVADFFCAFLPSDDDGDEVAANHNTQISYLEEATFGIHMDSVRQNFSDYQPSTKTSAVVGRPQGGALRNKGLDACGKYSVSRQPSLSDAGMPQSRFNDTVQRDRTGNRPRHSKIPQLVLPCSLIMINPTLHGDAKNTHDNLGVSSNRSSQGVVGTVLELKHKNTVPGDVLRPTNEENVMLSSRSGMTYDFDQIGVRQVNPHNSPRIPSPCRQVSVETRERNSCTQSRSSCDQMLDIIEELTIGDVDINSHTMSSQVSGLWPHNIVEKWIVHAIVISSDVEYKHTEIGERWTKANVTAHRHGRRRKRGSGERTADWVEKISTIRGIVTRLDPALRALAEFSREQRVLEREQVMQEKQNMNNASTGVALHSVYRQKALKVALQVGILLGDLLPSICFASRN